MSGGWIRNLAALLFMVSSVACGDRPVEVESRCLVFCRELRPRLINNFGIPPHRIDCEDGTWSAAKTCAACWEIIKREYDVPQHAGLCQDP